LHFNSLKWHSSDEDQQLVYRAIVSGKQVAVRRHPDVLHDAAVFQYQENPQLPLVRLRYVFQSGKHARASDTDPILHQRAAFQLYGNALLVGYNGGAVHRVLPQDAARGWVDPNTSNVRKRLSPLPGSMQASIYPMVLTSKEEAERYPSWLMGYLGKYSDQEIKRLEAIRIEYGYEKGKFTATGVRDTILSINNP
jgi:hypothetical protein